MFSQAYISPYYIKPILLYFGDKTNYINYWFSITWNEQEKNLFVTHFRFNIIRIFRIVCYCSHGCRLSENWNQCQKCYYSLLFLPRSILMQLCRSKILKFFLNVYWIGSRYVLNKRRLNFNFMICLEVIFWASLCRFISFKI